MRADLVAGIGAGGAVAGVFMQNALSGMPFVGRGLGGFLMGAVIVGLGVWIDMEVVGDLAIGLGVGYAVSSVI